MRRDRDVVKYRPQYKAMVPGEGHQRRAIRYAPSIPRNRRGDTPAERLQAIILANARFFRARHTFTRIERAKEHERSPQSNFADASLHLLRIALGLRLQPALRRLVGAERVHPGRRSASNYRQVPQTISLRIQSATSGMTSRVRPDKIYVVQTNPKVIQRCMLMTTDPGDLVLDPTCGQAQRPRSPNSGAAGGSRPTPVGSPSPLPGSGSLTARYEYFDLKEEAARCRGRVPIQDGPARHAQEHCAECKPRSDLRQTWAASSKRSSPLQTRRWNPLATSYETTSAPNSSLKQRQEGKKAITDADRRRWELPPRARHGSTGRFRSTPIQTIPPLEEGHRGIPCRLARQDG